MSVSPIILTRETNCEKKTVRISRRQRVKETAGSMRISERQKALTEGSTWISG